MSDRRGRAAALGGVALIAGYLFGRSRGRPEALAASADQERTRESALRGTVLGRPGAEGFRAAWPSGPGAVTAPDTGFQYADLAHQSETALAGMWLFLGTEALFFGGLLLLYAVYRQQYASGIAEAASHARVLIGTANTVILLTSSAAFTYGYASIQAGRSRALYRACQVTFALGLLFLLLKGVEWTLDLRDNLFPGGGFSITGANAGAAELFWSFYWIATGLHGLHMLAGLVLVSWLAWRTRAGAFTSAYHTPVEIVGLYWSFVDMVWLVLYPNIYLVGGRGA